MNIYLINEISTASSYGIGTYINNIICGLKDYAQLNIITLNSKEGEFQISCRNKVNYWDIPYTFISKKISLSSDPILYKKIYYESVVDLLKIYIKDTSDLIFHFNFIHNPFYELAYLLRKNFQCKIVSTIHYMNWALLFNGNAEYAKKLSETNSVEGRLLADTIQAEKKLFELSDRIICLTEHSVQQLIYVYNFKREKILVIPNGIKDVYQNFEARIDLRTKNNILPDEKIILFVGRLDELKGLSYLIAAFKHLVQQNKYCHLFIVGSGNYDFYFKQIRNIEKKVSFTGKIDQKELYELMAIADVGVMPSLYEPFGYVAVEMMMFGLPIVTTPRLSELLEDNISSLYVPIIEYKNKKNEINPQILSSKIDLLLHNDTLASVLGHNARQTFLNKFEIEHFRKAMIDLYHLLLTN